MKKFTILLLTGCLFFSSCGDWLDILPKNEQVTANYWKEAADVEAVLASGYYYMRECTPYMLAWGEVRAGSVYAHTANDPDIGGVPSLALEAFQLTSGAGSCKWSNFYKVINMANSVIKYAPEVEGIDGNYSRPARLSHQTEAYFMRALMYFYLVRNFKEVPLVTEPYVDDSAPYSIAKSPEERIIEQIKEDIQTALNSEAAKEYFDGVWATKGRATKWALYALMADVCLWSEDYDQAVINCNLLIEATSPHRPAFMTISQDWMTIFSPGNSNESIFELNWDSSTHKQTKFSPSQYFQGSTSTQYKFNEGLMERFLEESESLAQKDVEDVRGLYKTYSEDGYAWKYYGTEYPGVDRTDKDANLIIYRMADVLLMKAEALIWKGESTWQAALDLINQVRTRANLDPLELFIDEQDELSMLQYVLHERDMELAAEGKRWYDLMRLGKSKNFKYRSDFVDMVTQNNRSINSSWIRSVLRNEYAWYLPIHKDEVETNDLLEQNPYYETTN